MRKTRELLLLLLAALAIGCREEVVEELEDMGFKREWIPFGDAMGLPPLDENYTYTELTEATPWYVAQLASSPYTVRVDSNKGNRFLRVSTAAADAQEMRIIRWENALDLVGNKLRFTASVMPIDWNGDIEIGYYVGEITEQGDGGIKLPNGKWSKMSIEFDLPPTVEQFTAFIEADGVGELLIDNCTFEKIGVSSKGAAPRNIPVEHRNLAFEEGPRSGPTPWEIRDSLEYRIAPWKTHYYAGQYAPVLDSTTPRSGKYAGGLKSISAQPLSGSYIALPITAELVNGHKATYSLWLKTIDLNGLVSVAANTWSSERVLSYEEKRYWEIHGSTEWREITGEVDVPIDAETMNIIVAYTGHGTILVDDVS
ncbi:MAG TPA: hypothetical protein VFH43_13015, partial [Candidatus Kapabacteria bacterium]|nr:hypothetical protein [Candidatus Kapabacteria bacterium]